MHDAHHGHFFSITQISIKKEEEKQQRKVLKASLVITYQRKSFFQNMDST